MVTMATPMPSTYHKTQHTFNQSEVATLDLDVFPANKNHPDTLSQPITTTVGSQILQMSVQSDVGSSTPVTKMVPSNISYQSDAPTHDPTTNQNDPSNLNQLVGQPVASPVSPVLSPYQIGAKYSEASQSAPPSPASSSNQVRDTRAASQSAPVILSSPASSSNQMRDPQPANQSAPVLSSSSASSSNQMRDPRAATQSAPILFSSPVLPSNQMRDPQVINQSEAAALTNSTNQQMTQPFFQPKSAKTKNEGPV